MALEVKKILDKFSKMLNMTYFVSDVETKDVLYSNLKKRTYSDATSFLVEEKILVEQKLYVAQIDAINVITIHLKKFDGYNSVICSFMSSVDIGDVTNRLYANNLIEMINLIVYLITGEDLQFSAEQFFYNTEQKKILSPVDFVHMSISKDMKEKVSKRSSHHSYYMEKELMDAITNGKPETIKNMVEFEELTTIPDEKLAATALRSQKNKLISIVTISTRAAIEGGMDAGVGYGLSDQYIMLIEEMIDIRNIKKLFLGIMVDYAQRVQQINHVNTSRIIYNAQEYVAAHIYEKITVAQMAADLKMNSNYLSTKFKQETGVSLSSYIQEQKIREARKMILYTTMDFSNIYNKLHFSDQSHFIKTFKKHTGMLPSEYKEQHSF